MKLPVKVAPAWIAITPPGWEGWRAAWRSPPAMTAMSLPRAGGEYVVSRKTRGNSGSVWARARVGSRGIVWTHAKTKARRARRAGEPVPEYMVVSVPDINPEIVSIRAGSSTSARLLASVPPAKHRRRSRYSARKQTREPRHELIRPLVPLGSGLKLQHGRGHFVRRPAGPATVGQEEGQHGGCARALVTVHEDMPLD